MGNKHWHVLSGATEKPYLVEEAVSYNELDYVSVSPGSAAVCCRPSHTQSRARPASAPGLGASSSLRAASVHGAGGRSRA